MLVKVRLYFAWTMLVCSLIGWPLSMLTPLGNREPPFILSLSWLAIVVTAWGIIETSSVHHHQKKKEQ